jgi:hypothetical protein
MVALMTVLFALSFDMLKYSEMSCIDAQTLIDRVYKYNQQSEFITTKDADEIVEVIKESTPECFNEGSEQH